MESPKVYDPRLDTSPGAHPDDERYRVETTNAMLLMTDYQRAAGSPIDWDEVVKMANACEGLEPVVVDVVPGGKDSR